jgi:farnesyl-diphosphate farnesyltransferase
MNDWQTHLEKTSRTFALSIPLLDEPLRREVTIAYLLFRVADTLEDAATWPASLRSSTLRACGDVLRTGDPQQAARLAAHWVELAPTSHAGYLALLQAFPSLLQDARALRPEATRRIEHHLLRTIDRMDDFVQRAAKDDAIVLHSLDDLRAYCYAVAGIVGELLTDLFLVQAPHLRAVAEDLQRHAPAFGEGLQLVNIARDALDDAKEGRTFIPASMSVDDVLTLAHDDLDKAGVYVETLRAHGAPSGMVAFVALPVALARATLRKVMIDGAGTKLSRGEVAELMRQVQALSAAAAEPPWFRDRDRLVRQP